MSKSKEEGTKLQAALAKKHYKAGDELKVPNALSRKGYVVWFQDHGKYLGLAWNETSEEIERAHVTEADHAIYFETFAQAMVASDNFISRCRVLHSLGPGKRPKLMG